jgi:hypothetical protein
MRGGDAKTLPVVVVVRSNLSLHSLTGMEAFPLKGKIIKEGGENYGNKKY